MFSRSSIAAHCPSAIIGADGGPVGLAVESAAFVAEADEPGRESGRLIGDTERFFDLCKSHLGQGQVID